jgi:hypothetical protein
VSGRLGSESDNETFNTSLDKDAVLGDFVAGDEPLPEDAVDVELRRSARPCSPSSTAST